MHRQKPPALLIFQDQQHEVERDEWVLSPLLNEQEILLQVPSVLPDLQNDVAHLDEAQEDEAYIPLFEKLMSSDEFIPVDLLTAASIGDLSFMTYLIERSGVNPNVKNEERWTALMYASLYNHDSAVLYLLEMNAQVNEQNPNGKSSLMLAALCGHEDIVRILLDCGAAVNQMDKYENTPLLLAVSATHAETALLLLEAGANPNVRERNCGFTPLHLAAERGLTPLIRALLKYGGDVTARTSNGDTAYNIAVRNGFLTAANLINEYSQSFFSVPMLLAPASQPGNNYSQKNRPVPSHYKPRSPYSAFFDRFHNDSLVHDTSRQLPEPNLVSRNNINPFSAWPGSSIIFKQATANFNTPKDPPKDAEPERYAHKDGSPCPKDLPALLAELELSCYERNFANHDVNLQVFFTMNEENLKEIGINTVGHRKKLMSAIEYFRSCRHFLYVKDSEAEPSEKNKCECVGKLEQARTLWDELKLVTDTLSKDGASTAQTLTKLVQRWESVLGK